MEKNKTLNGGILKRWSQNGENPNEVVANCDHPEEVIANCENPQEKSLSQYDIEKLIVTVRGEQVLIDQDIARIYGVTTGRLNQQAKRNIARFPESFRFQLTKEERDEVIANCDHLVCRNQVADIAWDDIGVIEMNGPENKKPRCAW